MRSQILQGEPGGREAIFKTRDRSALKVDDSLMRGGDKACTFSVILMRVCTVLKRPKHRSTFKHVSLAHWRLYHKNRMKFIGCKDAATFSTASGENESQDSLG